MIPKVPVDEDWEPDALSPEIAVGTADVDEDWVVEDGATSTDGKAPLAPAMRYVQYAAAPCARANRLPRTRICRASSSMWKPTASPCSIASWPASRRRWSCSQRWESLPSGCWPHALPGPLYPRSSAPPGRSLVPSRSGPLLATLVYLGRASVPAVAERSTDPDPTVRAWATRVLGELPWPESAEAVGLRFCDPDETVRGAALAAARMLQADQPSRASLRDVLLGLCIDVEQSEEVRIAAILSLGELREDRAVAFLIDLLDDSLPSVVMTSHQVLVNLTAQDFGPLRSRYAAWWHMHANAHRIEWLIDALTHDRTALRRMAAEELKTVTKEYFGYYDDLPAAGASERPGALPRVVGTPRQGALRLDGVGEYGRPGLGRRRSRVSFLLGPGPRSRGRRARATTQRTVPRQ